MDWQPDTDLVDSRVKARPVEETDEEEVRPDDQVISEPEPTAPKPVPAPPGATLGAFFRMLGATLVASRPQPAASEGTRPSPQVARENVKQALQDLTESKTAEDDAMVVSDPAKKTTGRSLENCDDGQLPRQSTSDARAV